MRRAHFVQFVMSGATLFTLMSGMCALTADSTAIPALIFSNASSGTALWLQRETSSDIVQPSETVSPSLVPQPFQPLAIGPVTGHVVRVAYVIPSDRTPQAGGVAGLCQAMLLYQSWYRDQMERNGFGPKTFRLEMEADGVTPKIHVVNVTNTDENLREDIWGRTIDAAAKAGVPVWTARQVWFLISEAHLESADGSIAGGTALGASYGSGDDAGVAMLGGDALARFSDEYYTNDLAFNNRYIPEIGPYPLKQDVSFPWFEGTTFSSISSSILGAGIHEISHGFGLPHDFNNDQNFNGNLMGNGLRGIRGALYPDRYPSDYTRAAYGSALALNVSRYFNTERIYGDDTKPALIVSTTGTNSPVNGLLTIDFRAADTAGLSAALLQLNGDAVGEMALAGNVVSQTFATAYYTPGQANRFTVSVWDRQGNKQSVDTEIVPKAGINRAPQPFITISTPTALVGQNVVLDASRSTDPDGSLSNVGVEWDTNGDGTFDTAPTLVKTRSISFGAPGDFLIRCRLTDGLGAKSTSAPLALRIVLPELAISRTENGIQISWSTNAGGFVLQSTPLLPATNWLTMTQKLTIANGRNILLVTNPADNQLFQLKR